MHHARALKFPISSGLILALLGGAEIGWADPGLRPGQSVEISIVRENDGSLVADDVELLEEKRRPKLRGPIDALEPEAGAIFVLGQRILVNEDTEWEPPTGPGRVSALAPAQFVEVRCEVDALGVWYARSVETADIKRSIKVKGVITRLGLDIEDPEFLEVSGLRVQIVEGTDVLIARDYVAEDLFRDLREDDLVESGRNRGWLLGTRSSLSGSLRHDWRQEDGFDLDDGALRAVSEPSFRLEFLTRLQRNVKAFAQLRLRGRYDLENRGELIEESPDETNVDLRQLYLSWRDIGKRPVGTVVGKQRIRDEREFMFDEYLDALRFYAYGLRPFVLELTGVLPVAPLSDKFADWSDLIVQGRVYPREDWKLVGYGLVRSDQSERARDVRYWGLSVNGREGPMKLWGHATALRGTDKGLAQSSFALDAGIALRAKRWLFRPHVSAGFAMGTGDRNPDDGTSHEFRQTGYEDNSSRTWGNVNYQHFGEVLDPELSNLRIATASVGSRPFGGFGIDLVYHRFWLDQLTDELDQTDLIFADDPLNGISRDLGDELDVIVGLREILGRVHIAYKIGWFSPGDAFRGDPSTATIQKLEFRLDF